VTLSGKVVGPVTGDAHAGGLRFRLRDIGGKGTVPVVFHGNVPDLFKVGRHISVDGRLRDGVFRGVDPLVTKCPSKYAPKKSS
jgi:cytochrome c-type biogenesis protein CcmE